ncbi:MAG: nucleoside triphosphate pyrophosphohydrolase, partial [Paramuribaculum sp.]|nr:nucleoside triphosphate pyrophosphohydrolase [Paramuribaculum sp.]
WEERHQVWDKFREEIAEFSAEAENQDSEAMEKEMGDVFFSLINVARLYNINPENALEKTNRKFINRFNYIENKAREAGVNLKDLSLDTMDTWWNEAKSLE